MLPSRFYEDMLEEMESSKMMNCDIYEKDGKYHLEMDIPGFKKNEIKIECHKGTITVSAKKEFNKEEHDGNEHIKVLFDCVVPHEKHYNEEMIAGYLKEAIKEDGIDYEFIVEIDRPFC